MGASTAGCYVTGTSDEQEYYRKTLGFGDLDSKSRREAALKRAYELRNFEIELYWKRSLYFWGFQVAIFGALSLFKNSDSSSKLDPLLIALATLGVLVALAHALSSVGSSFWQNNWEMHIDFLEDEFEGSLYKNVWLYKNKRSYSVSRLNKNLLWFFVIFWICCFFIFTGLFDIILQLMPFSFQNMNQNMKAIVALCVLIVGIGFLLYQLSGFERAQLATRDLANPDLANPIELKWRRFRRKPSVNMKKGDEILIRRTLPGVAQHVPAKNPD